jgi:hypothetical protein
MRPLLVEGELDSNGCGRVPKPELHRLPFGRGEHRDRGGAPSGFPAIVYDVCT